jgi:hypothetical protein
MPGDAALAQHLPAYNMRMERVVRLLALAALLSLLAAGCGKDTVSNPGGGTGVAAQDSPQDGGSGVTAQGSSGQGDPAPSVGSQRTPDSEAGSDAAARAPSESGAESTAASDPPKAGAGEVVLRYNLKKGQRFTYEMTTNAEVMGRRVSTTVEYVANVVDASNDKYAIEYKFEDATVSTGDAQMKSMIEQEMTNLKGTSFTVDLDKLGKMSNPRGPGAPTFQSMGGESSFGFVFPEKPLKVGDAWTQTMPVPGMGGGSPLKINYKLTAISGNVATFAGSGSHSMQLSQPGGQQGSGSMSMKTDFSTTTKVDIVTGMAIETNVAATTTVSGGSGQASTQKVTVRLKRK